MRFSFICTFGTQYGMCVNEKLFLVIMILVWNRTEEQQTTQGKISPF